MKIKLILILIILIATFLRLYRLSSVPPHLTPDEASIGYNAYSILKTGRDEWGARLPIVFKSFGDYKPGLYIYTDVPFISILGLNEFSIRLPSALAGVAAVFLIYLIVSLLFDSYLGLICSFILTISPWHIFFSRGAWEANLSLTLTLIGIYLFIRGLKNQYFLILSAIFFSATTLTYQGAKLSTFIVLVLLLILYFPKITNFKKNTLIISLLIGAAISIPILVSFLQGKTGRLEVFSIFSYPRPKELIESFLNEGNETTNSLSYYFFHSETLNFIRGITGRWFNHFSGKFLFFEGDYSNLRQSSPYQGVMLISDILFLPLGLFVTFKSKLKKSHLFILLWLILSPLPAILTRDQVHAVRSLNMIIPLTIVTSFGVYYIFQQKLLYKLMLLAFVPGLIFFIESYFIELPHLRSQYWYYGYKQAVEYITPIQNQFSKIYFQNSYNQPYIYFLLYQKYDPKKYQQNSQFTKSENKSDVGTIENLDNIRFTEINWQIYSQEKNVLIVDDSNIHIPSEVQTKDIKYLNNLFTAVRFYQTQK